MLIEEKEKFSDIFPSGIDFELKDDTDKVKSEILKVVQKAIKKAGGTEIYLY